MIANSSRVFERFDNHLCASGSSGLDRLVHVCDRISGPLISKGKRHWCLIGKDRNCAYRSQHELHLGTAGNGGTFPTLRLEALPPNVATKVFTNASRFSGAT